ncbi:MAG: OsmC family protein [Candidatus Orphnella occulta]|nr:OsmC family protein [Candidatus Orphnella occulta]MDP8297771.1 OsmC family protein [Candidatus Orphnella occulta]
MYKVDIVNKSGYSFKATSDGHEFYIDAKGNGPSPSSLFLASLGSCIGVYIRKYLDGVKIESDKFTVEVESEFAKERPISFKEIRVRINLEDMDIDEKRKKSLLHFVKNCPIHGTISSKPTIDIDIS